MSNISTRGSPFPAVFTSYELPTTIEPPDKRHWTDNISLSTPQAVVDSCLCDLQGHTFNMTCNPQLRSRVSMSESTGRNRLGERHSLSADGRKTAGIEGKWPIERKTSRLYMRVIAPAEPPYHELDEAVLRACRARATTMNMMQWTGHAGDDFDYDLRITGNALGAYGIRRRACVYSEATSNGRQEVSKQACCSSHQSPQAAALV